MSTEYLVLDNADPNGLTIEVQEHSNKFDIAFCKKEYQDDELVNPVAVKDLSQDQLENLAIQLIKVANYWNPDFIDHLLCHKEKDIYGRKVPMLGDKSPSINSNYVNKKFKTLVEVELVKGLMLPIGSIVKLEYLPSDPKNIISNDVKGYYVLNHSIYGVHKFFLSHNEVEFIVEE